MPPKRQRRGAPAPNPHAATGAPDVEPQVMPPQSAVDAAVQAPNVDQFDVSHWFSDVNEHRAFMNEFGLRRVVEPRWLHCQFFTNEGFHFHELLEAQGLRQFVELNNSFGPDLVQAYLCNVKVNNDGSLQSTLANRVLTFTPDAWLEVTGVQYRGRQLKFNDPECIADFNRVDTLHPYLKNLDVIPGSKAKTSLLNMEGRLLHYVIVRMLNVHGGNYVTILESGIIMM